MRSTFLPLALPVSLVFLLAACGHEEAAQTTVRPAMVVQPQPSAQSTDSYPGEVRARYEPDLAFRIGGKVSKRLVEEGERVKANQALAELDPRTCACNWKPPVPKWPPPRMA